MPALRAQRALRGLRFLLSAVGWALLCAMALAGVGISALVLGAALPATRPVVASALIRYADAAVAGRLSLDGVDVLPGGAFAIQGFKAYDPDGQLVLQVDRLLVSADVTRLRNKVVGLEVELTGAAVLVDEDAEGRLSLARAFAPAQPSTAPKRQASWEDLGGWTIRLRKLTVREASVWWQDADRVTRLELQELSIDGRAIAGPRRVRAELSLEGQAYAPLEGPISARRPGAAGRRSAPGAGARGAAGRDRALGPGRARPGQALRPRRPHQGHPRPEPGQDPGAGRAAGRRPLAAGLRRGRREGGDGRGPPRAARRRPGGRRVAGTRPRRCGWTGRGRSASTSPRGSSTPRRSTPRRRRAA